MHMVKIFLRDQSQAVTDAWEKRFENVPMVDVSTGDIFDLQADAIISPANSFGFMDGGIDLVYSRHFGWNLQERLQAVIHSDFEGELLVGQAVVVETNHPEIPFLVSAPTMRVPEVIANTVNVYLAFRAALRAVRDFNLRHSNAIQSVLCPGLGTATGAMPPERCAKQMRMAYDAVLTPRIGFFPGAAVLNEHLRLLK